MQMHAENEYIRSQICMACSDGANLTIDCIMVFANLDVHVHQRIICAKSQHEIGEAVKKVLFDMYGWHGRIQIGQGIEAESELEEFGNIVPLCTIKKESKSKYVIDKHPNWSSDYDKWGVITTVPPEEIEIPENCKLFEAGETLPAGATILEAVGNKFLVQLPEGEG